MSFDELWKEIEAEADRLLAAEQQPLVIRSRRLAQRAWAGLKYVVSFRWARRPRPAVHYHADGMACSGPCGYLPNPCKQCSKYPCVCRIEVPPGYQLKHRPPPPAPMKREDPELKSVFIQVQSELEKLLEAERTKLGLPVNNEARVSLGLPPFPNYDRVTTVDEERAQLELPPMPKPYRPMENHFVK